MKCLICGRAVTTNESAASVVIGTIEGREFTIHARCFMFDDASLGSRLSVMIGFRNEDSEAATDLALRAMNLERSR